MCGTYVVCSSWADTGYSVDTYSGTGIQVSGASSVCASLKVSSESIGVNDGAPYVCSSS